MIGRDSRIYKRRSSEIDQREALFRPADLSQHAGQRTKIDLFRECLTPDQLKAFNEYRSLNDKTNHSNNKIAKEAKSKKHLLKYSEGYHLCMLYQMICNKNDVSAIIDSGNRCATDDYKKPIIQKYVEKLMQSQQPQYDYGEGSRALQYEEGTSSESEDSDREKVNYGIRCSISTHMLAIALELKQMAAGKNNHRTVQYQLSCFKHRYQQFSLKSIVNTLKENNHVKAAKLLRKNLDKFE